MGYVNDDSLKEIFDEVDALDVEDLSFLDNGPRYPSNTPMGALLEGYYTAQDTKRDIACTKGLSAAEASVKLSEIGVDLESLRNSEFWEVRCVIARNGWMLDTLIDDEHPVVRLEVAERGFGLDKLAFDEDYSVRQAVAAQGFGLDALVLDNSKVVRNSAENYLRQAGTTIEEWAVQNPEKSLPLFPNPIDFKQFGETGAKYACLQGAGQKFEIIELERGLWCFAGKLAGCRTACCYAGSFEDAYTKGYNLMRNTLEERGNVSLLIHSETYPPNVYKSLEELKADTPIRAHEVIGTRYQFNQREAAQRIEAVVFDLGVVR